MVHQDFRFNLVRKIWEIDTNLVLEVEHRLSEVGSSILGLHGKLHELSIAVHTPHLGSLQGLFVCVSSTHRRRPFPQSAGDLGRDAFTRSDWRSILLCYYNNFVSGKKSENKHFSKHSWSWFSRHSYHGQH